MSSHGHLLGADLVPTQVVDHVDNEIRLFLAKAKEGTKLPIK